MPPEHASLISEDHLNAVERLLGTKVINSALITEGANNQVYHIKTASGLFILKYYPDSPNDHRDRFKAETEALNFMNAAELSCVPELVGYDIDNRLAVTRSVKGDTIKTVTSDHIQAAVNFTLSLHKARNKNNAHRIEAASEACLSPADVTKQIISRRNQLEETITEHPGLRLFLEQKFDSAFQDFQQDATQQFKASGINPETILTDDQLTLSPSDFGFHNALAINGDVIFLDFEYFGWDDPVKLVSDFLLHPGHQLRDTQKQQFVRATSSHFVENDKSFLPRLLALYPLIGLRWCMILLNEFVPERLVRRRAAGNQDDTATIHTQQLKKSESLLTMLNKTKRVLPL